MTKFIVYRFEMINIEQCDIGIEFVVGVIAIEIEHLFKGAAERLAVIQAGKNVPLFGIEQANLMVVNFCQTAHHFEVIFVHNAFYQHQFFRRLAAIDVNINVLLPVTGQERHPGFTMQADVTHDIGELILEVFCQRQREFANQWLWRLFVTVIPAQNFVGRDLFDGVDVKQSIH